MLKLRVTASIDDPNSCATAHSIDIATPGLVWNRSYNGTEYWDTEGMFEYSKNILTWMKLEIPTPLAPAQKAAKQGIGRSQTTTTHSLAVNFIL
jgi:hypothetical protein